MGKDPKVMELVIPLVVHSKFPRNPKQFFEAAKDYLEACGWVWPTSVYHNGPQVTHKAVSHMDKNWNWVHRILRIGGGSEFSASGHNRKTAWTGTTGVGSRGK